MELENLAFYSAYIDEDEKAKETVIMINPVDTEGEHYDFEFEECMCGGTYKNAVKICLEFNKLKTQNIDDFYDIRNKVELGLL